MSKTILHALITSITNAHVLKTAQHTEHFGPQQGTGMFNFQSPQGPKQPKYYFTNENEPNDVMVCVSHQQGLLMSK